MGLLRLLLAFAIVLSHSAPLYGFIGIGGSAVPAFFVISGFYMNLVLSTRYLRMPGGIKAFYFNRFLRLFPLYWAVLVVFLIVSMIPQSKPATFLNFIIYLAKNSIDKSTDGSIASLWAAIPNLFMLGSDVLRTFAFSVRDQQLVLMTPAMTSASEFVDMGTYLVVPPVWSLGVELVCYAASPFLSRLRSRWLLACFVLSLIAQHLWIGNVSLAWPHLGFWFNVPYFILGMLAYRSLEIVAKFNFAVRFSLALIPFAIWAFFPTAAQIASQANIWILWILYAIGISALFTITRNIVIDGKIGDLSYPVYLIHWLFAWPAVAFGAAQPIIAMLASCVLSIILVKCIDAPIEKFKKKA